MIRILPAAWPVLGVRAFTTLRTGGCSVGPYASLNLASHVGDAPQDVAANRMALQRELDIKGAPVWLNQVHGRTVIDAGASFAAPPEADGSFTTRPGVVCAVLTADCLPVVLADRKGQCVAVVHAGWRGLAAGVIEAGLAALPVPPPRLVAWLGPAIGAADYEVGDEVRRAFGRAARDAFTPNAQGRYFADLYALARLRLQAAGIGAVYGGGQSCFSHPDLFSYRRTPVCGRMATLAWIA